MMAMDKVKIAIERLQMFMPQEGYWLGFSGGKDSCVVKKLCDMASVKYDAHYSVTTLDPPELVRFIKEKYPDVIFERPGITFFRLVEKKGLPTRLARWCCELLKERGGEGRTVVLGIRAEESRNRANTQIVQRCLRGVGKVKIHPIADWSLSDVWRFIGKYDVPYCSLYDEGFKRIGCVMCPFSDQKKGARRFPKFVKAYKNAIAKRIDYLKSTQNFKSSFIKDFENADEIFDWWISGKSIKAWKEE